MVDGSATRALKEIERNIEISDKKNDWQTKTIIQGKKEVTQNRQAHSKSDGDRDIYKNR